MYCIKCGRRLTDTRNLYICPYCGNQSYRSTDYYTAGKNEDYRLQFPEQQTTVMKNNNFLFVLIPAIGAAAIFVLLILAGVIRFSNPAYAAEMDQNKEYDFTQMAADDLIGVSDYSSEPVNAVTGTLLVKESTNQYSQYVRVKKEETDQDLYEELMPTEYLPENERETETTPVPTEEPAPDVVPTTIPTQEPEHAGPSSVPDEQPRETEPSHEAEDIPAHDGTNDGNLTPGALRYSPVTYINEPFRSEQIIPSSSYEDISYMDLTGYSDEALRIARNEIYARHGRLFVTEDLQRYFNGCSWYLGRISPAEFDLHEMYWLSSLERRNIEYIVAIENARNGQ